MNLGRLDRLGEGRGLTGSRLADNATYAFPKTFQEAYGAFFLRSGKRLRYYACQAVI